MSLRDEIENAQPQENSLANDIAAAKKPVTKEKTSSLSQEIQAEIPRSLTQLNWKRQKTMS